MPLFENNLSPYLTIVEATEPAAPSAGQQRLYIDSTTHLLKATNSSGTDRTIEGLTDPMTTRGDVIIRNASNVTARLAIGSSGKVLSSDGTDISWQTPSSGGGLLGITAYAGTGTPTIASTTMADVDATNMKVVFTAPTSTNVLVRLTAVSEVTGGGYSVWSLRESTTNLHAGSVITAVSDGIRIASAVFLISGISGGSHTYKWAWKSSAGGVTAKIYTDATDGPATMEVWGGTVTRLTDSTQTFVRPRYQGEGPSESCIISGHLLGWTNCTPASFAMAVEAASNLQKRSDPCTIRRATGDTSGGTTLRQCADAVQKLYGITVSTYTGGNVLTPQRVAREVRAGRRCVVQGNTSALIGKPQQSTQGGVNHAVMVNEVRGGTLDEPTEALVYDPAADGRKRAYHVDQGPSWWPWSLVKTFAAHLRPTGETGARLGPGKVYTAVFPDSEPHVRLRPGAKRSTPFPDRTRAADPNDPVTSIHRTSDGKVIYTVKNGTLLVLYQYANGRGYNDDGTEWVLLSNLSHVGGAT